MDEDAAGAFGANAVVVEGAIGSGDGGHDGRCECCRETGGEVSGEEESWKEESWKEESWKEESWKEESWREEKVTR
jgi:hypothetical protein